MATNLSSTELKRLHREWRRRTPARLSIGLDGVQGPFNVGAIIRSAAAYKSEYLWLTETATGPDNSKVDKTALGTARYLTTNRVADATAIADAARAAGYRVVGVELAAGAVPMHELDLRVERRREGHAERGRRATRRSGGDIEDRGSGVVHHAGGSVPRPRR